MTERRITTTAAIVVEDPIPAYPFPERDPGRAVATTEGTLNKPPSGELSVPVHFRTLTGVEGISLGFRQHMFSLGEDGDGRPLGEVATGAGWGTDAIIMRWGDENCVVRGLDLLRAWVSMFDPEAVKRFP